MPFSVREKCERCGEWNWFLLLSEGEYICDECKQKEKELKTDALFKLLSATNE